MNITIARPMNSWRLYRRNRRWTSPMPGSAMAVRTTGSMIPTLPIRDSIDCHQEAGCPGGRALPCPHDFGITSRASDNPCPAALSFRSNRSPRSEMRRRATDGASWDGHSGSRRRSGAPTASRPRRAPTGPLSTSSRCRHRRTAWRSNSDPAQRVRIPGRPKE